MQYEALAFHHDLEEVDRFMKGFDHHGMPPGEKVYITSDEAELRHRVVPGKPQIIFMGWANWRSLHMLELCRKLRHLNPALVIFFFEGNECSTFERKEHRGVTILRVENDRSINGGIIAAVHKMQRFCAHATD